MYKEVIKVSKIEIVPIPPKNGLVAFASFLINDCFFIGNVAIYSSPSCPNGFRLVFPTKAGVSCFHPVNRAVGMKIQNQVISRYLEIIEKLTKSGEKLNEQQEST